MRLKYWIFCYFILFCQTALAAPLEISLMDGLKQEIEDEATLRLLQELQQEKHAKRSGFDHENRPLFVGLQALFERKLTSLLQQDSSITAMVLIHTPLPATPLCQALGEPGTFNRQEILQKLLQTGCTLFVIYPAEGLRERNNEQRTVYQKNCETYPNTLRDCPLPIDSLPAELVGATYFLRQRDEEVVFSLKGYQINAPKDDGNWHVWYGNTSDPEVALRTQKILKFLDSSGWQEVQ